MLISTSHIKLIAHTGLARFGMHVARINGMKPVWASESTVFMPCGMNRVEYVAKPRQRWEGYFLRGKVRCPE